MARDPLLVLRAVRLRAVERARQGLAARLKTEAEAAAKVDGLTEAARLDRSAGEDMPDAHQFLQMFANRLDAVRTQRIAAGTSLTMAQARVAEARVVVVAARTQAEALEQLITAQETARVADAERKAQHEMDDVARAAHAVRRVGRI
jgi:flagellar biosynthesis chaperone FliJ